MPGRRSREESRYADASRRLANNLKTAREQRAMTQQRLATLADVSIGTVRKVESHAVVEPGIFTVMAIAKALNYDITDFISAEARR